MDCKTAQQMIMPYIRRSLSDRETEDFIEHIRGCKACSEELEVYFTIHYALDRLDRDDRASYNISALLEQDLKEAEDTVQKHRVVRFYERVLSGLLTVLVGLLLFTMGQAVFLGSLSQTTLYGLFAGETEEESHAASAAKTSKTEQGETEAETNRKKQVIVKTPETEAKMTEEGQLQES